MQERDNILRILKETKQAFEQRDSLKLKGLSNQTINTASLTHDVDNIAVAVVVYSLSKIIERHDYKNISGWEKFKGVVGNFLEKAIVNVEKNNDNSFRKNFEEMRKSIQTFSGNLKQNIEDVFRKASINKASRIYEHGTSMERTAELLGITQYELANYAGQKDIPNIAKPRITDVKSRIKLAMDFFR
jgi:hypothetical protein